MNIKSITLFTSNKEEIKIPSENINFMSWDVRNTFKEAKHRTGKNINNLILEFTIDSNNKYNDTGIVEVSEITDRLFKWKDLEQMNITTDKFVQYLFLPYENNKSENTYETIKMITDKKVKIIIQK